MSLSHLHWSVCLLPLSFGVGCVSSERDSGSCEAGNERCVCFGNGTCNDGLTCLSNHCVNVDGMDGGESLADTDDAQTQDTDAEGADDGSTEDTDGMSEKADGGESSTSDTMSSGGSDDGDATDASPDPTDDEPDASVADVEATDDESGTDSSSPANATDEPMGTDTAATDPMQTPTDAENNGSAGAGGSTGEQPPGAGGSGGASGGTNPWPLPEFRQKLISPPPVAGTGTVEYNGFSRAMALSGDLLVVGSADAELGVSAGAAYAYVFQDGSWQFDAKILPQLADGTLDGQANGFFGTALTMKGGKLLVSATGKDSHMGAVYSYQRVDGVWEPRGKLVATTLEGVEERQESARFGMPMAISGNTALIGSTTFRHDDGTEGVVYVYVEEGGNWSLQARLVAELPDGTPAGLSDSAFAAGLSISGDTVAIGDYFVDTDVFNTGAVYTYVRTGATWFPEAYLVARTTDGEIVNAENMHFGLGTHVFGDYLFVSSEDDYEDVYRVGCLYVFERSGGSWLPKGRIWPRFGDGSLDVYTSGKFGVDVSMSGNQLAVGATGTDERGDGYGAVYLYELNGDEWASGGKLIAVTDDGPDARSGDVFGNQVELDGSHLIVGAWGDDEVRTDSGSVYVFEMP